MQFHIPSVVQAVPAAIALPVPVVPVLAGLATGAAELAATEATGLEATTGLAATEEAATGAAVAEVWVPADEATVAKTPPETAGADEAATGAEVATDAAEVAPVPDPPVVAAAPATVLPHDDPVGATGVAVDPPSSSRESPGAGNLRSVESTVPQPLPMFAVNIFGSASKAAVSRSMS